MTAVQEAAGAVDVWPIIVAIIGAVGAIVAILAGLGSIRREQRTAETARMEAKIADSAWRAEIRNDVTRIGQRVDAISSFFDSPVAGSDDLSLPAQVRDLRRTVADTRTQMADLDTITRSHMAAESEAAVAESASRQADSREIRETLRDGLDKVHDRIDAASDAVGRVSFDLAHLADRYEKHKTAADERDTRIVDLEGHVSDLQAELLTTRRRDT